MKKIYQERREEMTIKEKTKIISRLLNERGFISASKDCNKKNYKEYAEYLIGDFYKSVSRINIETKKISVNEKIFDIAMKIEAMLISAKIIEYKDMERMGRVKKSINFFLSHNGFLDTKGRRFYDYLTVSLWRNTEMILTQ